MPMPPQALEAPRSFPKVTITQHVLGPQWAQDVRDSTPTPCRLHLLLPAQAHRWLQSALNSSPPILKGLYPPTFWPVPQAWNPLFPLPGSASIRIPLPPPLVES